MRHFVIKFVNQPGDAEYLAPFYGITHDLSYAHLVSKEEAEDMVERSKAGGFAEIWKTAKVIPVKIVEA